MQPEISKLRCRRPPKLEQARIIYEKTILEINNGFLQPLMDEDELNDRFGPGAWAFMMRFALDPKGKIRLIDNGAEGHNETFGAAETIHTTSSSAAACVARCFRKHAGRKLKGGVADTHVLASEDAANQGADHVSETEDIET